MMAAPVDIGDAAAQKHDKGQGSEKPAPNGRRSRTLLWCVPRSGSTALTKCLSFIEGIQVWFEPYTYCKVATVNFKEQLGIDLPTEYEGNEEIYRRMADHFRESGQGNATKPEYLSFESIGGFLERSASSHVLVKDIPIKPEHYKFIPKGFKHIFLIRHPLRVFTSFRKAARAHLSSLGVLTSEETFDVGRDYPYSKGTQHKELYDLWKYVHEDLGAESVVVDADDLLTKPAEMLPKICRAVGLAYDETLLKWDGSPEVVKSWMFPAEGIIEKTVHFYETAIRSSEFLPARRMPSRGEVTADVITCTDRAMPYHNEMYEVRSNPVHSENKIIHSTCSTF